jgi:hypothetical protein
MSLAELRLEDFQPTLDQVWTLNISPDVALPLVLIGAQPLGQPPAASTGLARQAFSLIWRGPQQPILPQQVYQLLHPSFAQPIDLFLVPLGADGATPDMRYEAIFT